MDLRNSGIAPAGQHPLRHGAAFILSGGIAFSIDALILQLLTTLFGWSPIPARLIAVSVAMVAAWLAHRTFTFAVRARPSVAEFLRYLAVAWTSVTLNYGLFVLVLLIRPATVPFIALVISSAGAMIFSYFGLRFAAFRERTPHPDGDGTPPPGTP